MARTDPDDARSPTSWVGWKERGSNLFQRGDYEAALNAYTQALRPEFECPSSEKQILLSNVVACRLKIGGRAQAEAAVEAAKQCVALNDSWAKAHVRLASSYIALGGDHSNDACNELQRALQLDPGHPTARDMLVRELRRDRVNNNAASSTSSSSSAPSPSAPPADLDDHDYSQRQNQSQQQQRQPQDQYVDPHNIDDSISWQERSQFYIQRAKFWYSSQSDDVKGVLKVFCALVVLYVAFGGRFGLEYLSGNSGSNHPRHQSRNAYDDFYQQRHRSSQDQYRHQQTGNNHRDRYDPYSRGSYDYQDQGYHHRRRRGNSWSLGGDNLSIMVILGAVFFAAQRFGINPFQALFFANMAIGGRGRGMGRRRGMYGGGFGRGGMMGMGGFRRPGRPRW